MSAISIQHLRKDFANVFVQCFRLLIGFAEDIWMVGVIDEIRMPLTENHHNPILIDTKTRARDTIPVEPQRRN